MMRKIGLGGALLSIAFIIGYLGASAPTAPAVPGFLEPGAGSELTLVLVVSTRCAWSADPDLPRAWNDLVVRTSAALPPSFDRLSTIGIGEAGSPEEGYEFLTRFGAFHEIVVGRHLNTASLRYIVNDLRGPGATPQVLVVHREFAQREDGSIYPRSEVVVRRIIGVAAITRAAERGLPSA